MDTLLRDLRFGLRILRKNIGLTIMAALTLGLGIGANTVIFSAVNTVLLRPLPFKESDRLVQLWTTEPARGKDRVATSYPDFRDWKEQSSAFEDMSIINFDSFILTGGSVPERALGGTVSANFFRVLGVHAVFGRTFLPEEEDENQSQVMVLSHNLWQRAFNGDQRIIGEKVQIEGVAYTVVGVLPPDFRFIDRPVELWIPLALPLDSPLRTQRQSRWMPRIIARLKPGFTADQADQQLKLIAGRLAQEHPGSAGISARVINMAGELTRQVRPAFYVLLVAVGFVLLIACANVASLLLARAASREKEMALRATLGVGRYGLLRQLFTENLLLALLGGGLGLLLSYWGVKAVALFGPNNIPRLQDTALDLQGLLFTLGATLLTALIFGLAPAWRTVKPELYESLKDKGHGSSGGRKAGRMLKALVVSEVALALVLLIGAGLMIKSLLGLTAIQPGFNPENILTMFVPLSASRYRQENQRVEFFRQLLERIRSTPGVDSAAVTFSQGLPFRSSGTTMTFGVDGRPPAATPSQNPTATVSQNTPEYFQAMGIPLLSGRSFSDQDVRESQPVVVISDTMARRHFATENPIGKQIWVGDPAGPRRTIVGVVGDIKFRRLDEPFDPAIYTPYYQGFPNFGRVMWLVVRTKSDPASYTSAIRGQVWALDKDQPVDGVSTMEGIIDGVIAQQRFSTVLLGVFAATALVLASVGIYGVISHSVTQRTREIGIRMALGAQRRDILRLVVWQGVALALIGVGIGLVAAYLLTKGLSRLLYDISAADPLIYLCLAALLVIIAILACYIPARRAMRIDPVKSLRYE